MNILQPYLLLLAIPLLLLLVWLLSKDFVPGNYLQPKDIRRRNRMRWFLLLTRSIVILAIVLALAHPVIETESFIDQDPEIMVLIDNSSSMSLMDTEPALELIAQLEERLPVRTRYIGTGGDSPLGDDILGRLGPGQNLLLITDGQVTSGAGLADVAAFAGSINATLNAITLEPRTEDAAIRILGPEKAVEGVEESFSVIVSSAGDTPVPLQVALDGEILYASDDGREGYLFKDALSIGEHEIVATITAPDGVSENNRYVHTVSVVEKPRILYVSEKRSGLEQILSTLYRVDVQPRIPNDISPYYAVVFNDLPASRFGGAAVLTEYLLDGNGVFFVGGQNSFDFGGYKGSVLETVLPVRVGAGERSKGGANIVVAIDLSGSTRGAIRYETRQVDGEVQVVEIETTAEVQSLQKALALSLIEELNPSNNVGVLGFVYPQMHSPYACTGACVIHPVEPLAKQKEAVMSKVARVNITGGTSLGVGMEGAFEMLRGKAGSKNILFISDGISNAADEQRALAVAKTVAAQGGRVYAVQVGDSPDGKRFMQQLAVAGNGIYFHATTANRLSVLFGEPVSLDQGDAFDVFALDEHHFITRDLELQATLYGYNQVAPKQGSRLLLTSTGGDPVLTVWSYGVGRVAALTAFNGDDIGSLLSAPSSKAISRTVNWLIGDPERHQDVSASIADTTLGKPARLTVHAERLPTIPGVEFSPVGNDVFVGSVPADALGVFEVAGTAYAVNYPVEWQRVGLSEQLPDALVVSGGGVFSPDDPDAIINHVKTLQQLRRVNERDFRWVFLAGALLVLLIEIIIRRILELLKR